MVIISSYINIIQINNIKNLLSALTFKIKLTFFSSIQIIKN